MIKGKIYEDLAVKFLKENRFEIIERNFRCRFGEIDIIAKEKNILCFIEVKKRKGNSLIKSYEAVDKRKREKILKTSLFYLNQCKEKFSNVRYDVVCLEEKNGKILLDLIKGAFCFD